MTRSLILIALTTILAVTAQLLLKAGMTQVGHIGGEQLANPVRLVIMIVTNPRIALAMPMYVAGFFLWTVVLSRVQLSFAHPLMASTYAIVPLVSWLLLGETLSAQKVLGIVVICIGVFIVVSSQR